jgi:hypothetical protein
MTVTMIAAGILGLLLVILSVRVSLVRRTGAVSLGDGGNPDLLVRIRAQANCAEYVPIGLILLFLAEQLAGAHWAIVALGALLVVARIMHPIGMAMPAPNVPRVLGTAGTWTAIAFLALICLFHGIERALA